MKKYPVLLLLILLCFRGSAQERELRGTWLAWAGTAVPSTKTIAATMDSLAAANLNTVYVDVWRFGYPYYRSALFHSITGLYTDPSIETAYRPNRDVLAEMIVEAHRVGLEVEAWFESGFNGAHDIDSPLFQAQPRWFARTKDNEVARYGQDGEVGPSMIQCDPDVQQFLIDMCQEVIRNYDIDGIDMDRIRYPSLDCGYDPVTVALYKSEHDGAEPPQQEWDPDWKQWRADKLTEFMGRMYDSLKAVNSEVTVSNAPLPWGPDQFCQDWAPWVNNGYLDIVVPQMYYNTVGSFNWRLDTELQYINDDERVYPGISTVANENYTDPSQLAAMIESIRDHGLHGHVIWYHANLIWHTNQFLPYLKETVYAETAEIPYRDVPRRRPAIFVAEDGENVEHTGGWQTYDGGIPLWDGSCLYTSAGSGDTISYFADIPDGGWYELYVFVNRQTYASSSVIYQVESAAGPSLQSVNQKQYGNAGRWHKLADVHFGAGDRQKILTLAAADAAVSGNDKYVFTDAVMLLNSNRPEAFLTNVEGERDKPEIPQQIRLHQNYPNPFNIATTVSFSLPQPMTVRLRIYNLAGQLQQQIVSNRQLSAGIHQFSLTGEGWSTGLYFTVLETETGNFTQKMMLLK